MFVEGLILPQSQTAVLYGANASSKSNLLWAMDALSYFVTRSSLFKPQ